MAEKQIASITLKVDVSEALTGLKALTREARKATAALAELREAMKEPQNTIGDKFAISYGRIGTVPGAGRNE